MPTCHEHLSWPLVNTCLRLIVTVAKVDAFPVFTDAFPARPATTRRTGLHTKDSFHIIKHYIRRTLCI